MSKLHTIREYQDSDYSLLQKWLGPNCPSSDLFSQTGIVIDECAVGFVFRTDSKTAFLSEPYLDDTQPVEKISAAIEKLFAALTECAENIGATFVVTFALEKYRGAFEGAGYLGAPTQSTLFIKALSPGAKPLLASHAFSQMGVH